MVVTGGAVAVVVVVVEVVVFFVVVVVVVLVVVVVVVVFDVVEVVVVVTTSFTPATFLYVARAISGYASLSESPLKVFERSPLSVWRLPILSRIAAAIAICPFWLGCTSAVLSELV